MTCLGSGTLKINILIDNTDNDSNDSNDSIDSIDTIDCIDCKNPLKKTQRVTTLCNLWCKCPEEHNIYYVPRGVSAVCNKEHWNCSNCKNIVHI